jgi:isopenicillin N synthase-like dioxygenase
VSRNFPVIDLEAVREPQASIGVRREIAHQVAGACEEIGFFAVTGHGVPGAVIADLVAESYAFLDLPLAEKLAVRRPRPEQNRGYIAPGEEGDPLGQHPGSVEDLEDRRKNLASILGI